MTELLCYEQRLIVIVGRDTIKDSIERDTQVKLEEMVKAVGASKESVIRDLMVRVINEIQPKLHHNLRLSDVK